MRLKEKKGKSVLQSSVCDKAVQRIKALAKEKIKEIARPSNGKSVTRAILDYNAFVMGEHNYYQMATDVSLDFADIGYHADQTAMRLSRSATLWSAAV